MEKAYDELANESVEDKFNSEEIQDKLMLDAQKKADKLIRKNKRELKRLKAHAGECVINNNYDGYAYAIKKLRKFYKQPCNDDVISIMWKTTREQMFNIINNAKETDYE